MDQKEEYFEYHEDDMKALERAKFSVRGIVRVGNKGDPDFMRADQDNNPKESLLQRAMKEQERINQQKSLNNKKESKKAPGTGRKRERKNAQKLQSAINRVIPKRKSKEEVKEEKKDYRKKREEAVILRSKIRNELEKKKEDEDKKENKEYLPLLNRIMNHKIEVAPLAPLKRLQRKGGHNEKRAQILQELKEVHINER